MKKFLQSLLFFLLVTQICFAQANQQNRESNPNIKKSLFDRQDKYFPIIDKNIQGKSYHEFFITKIADKFRCGDDKHDVNCTWHPFLNDKSYRNVHETNTPPVTRMFLPQSQINVIDTAILISEQDTMRHLYSFNEDAKMTVNLIQELVGDIWVTTERHTYIYDGNNNVLSRLEEYWENSQLKCEIEQMYTYDANNNILTYLVEYRNKTQYSARYTYTYDAKNNMLSYLYEEGIIGQLDNKSRYTYTYDTNNNMLSYLQEYWEDGKWLLGYRCTNIYDVNNKIFSLSEYWENGKWVYDSKITYTYDSNNNMLSFLDERWYNNHWIYYYRVTYTYDAKNNLLSELREYGGVFDTRYTYSYDINNNILTHSIESWVNGQWQYENRDTYTYDENSNILHALHEDWDNGLFNYGYSETYTYDAYNNMLSFLARLTENGEWVDDFRVTYTYDKKSNLISVWYHRWSDSSWLPMNGWCGPGGGFSIGDSEGNRYDYSCCYNITFIYKFILTEVESPIGESLEIYSLSQNYPNPFNPSTTIKYEIPKQVRDDNINVTLRVYDILGREVATLVNEKQKPVNYEVTWDASNHPSGIYFYRITANNFIETKKMILLK